jgi:hypothetical protein
MTLNSNEYYAEVDKRMRVDFPHKFGNTDTKQTTSKPVQSVASANRSVKPGRKTVRLTSSQVAIAKKLGVPLEEYAKQLKHHEGRYSVWKKITIRLLVRTKHGQRLKDQKCGFHHHL